MFVWFSVFLSFTFWATEAQETLANVTRKDRNSLPELPDGGLCTPGNSYRVRCNTCRCGQNNSLLCTQMACLDDNTVSKLLRTHHKDKLDNKQILRSNKSNEYPDYSPTEICIPGKIYKNRCNKCFCTESKVILCSLKGCSKNKTQFTQGLIPEDVRPPFTASELDSLVVLPHSAAHCIAGRSYRIDCNPCLCKIDGNLLCDQLLCFNYDSYNTNEAAKQSGSPCKKDVSSSKCINCKCLNGKTKCKAKESCISDMVPTDSLTGSKHKLLSKKKTRLGLAMDPHEDKCIPNQIYKQSCNKCYCQADGTMRCTQKKCLNYVEVVKLKRHKLFLAQHGD